MANIAIGFERWGISAQLSWNYHGKYIEEVGEDADGDIYYDTRTQLDLALSATLSPGLILFSEFINLSNSPLRYFQGDSDRLVQQEFYGIRVKTGIKYAF